MFTKSTAKLFKKADYICCQLVDSSSVYVSDGHIIFALTTEEYDKFVRPVTLRPAGNFALQGGAESGRTLDAQHIFRDALEGAGDSAALEFAPMVFPGSNCEMLAAYCREKDFVSVFNRDFISCLSTDVTYRATSKFSPALALDGKIPVAMILPIKPDPNIPRVVRAYYAAPAQSAAPESDRVEQLEAACKDHAQRAESWHTEFLAQERAAVDLRAALATAQQESNGLRAQLENLRANLAAVVEDKSRLAQQLEELKKNPTNGDETDGLHVQQPATAAAEGKSQAAALAESLAQIPGATVMIAGEKSRSPIIWISAATAAAAEAVRSAGGRWAEKKNAYYIHVA